MNTISISLGFNALTESQVEETLLISGHDILINHITYPKTGYGHWKLKLNITLDGQSITLKKTTTDSVMIDAMSHENDEVSNEAYASAILYVLSKCANELYDLTHLEIED
jgi:hypothetical protein